MIPVHLNETEDQVNDTDDQTAELNKLRKRDHGQLPLSIQEWGIQEAPPYRFGKQREERTACCLPAAPLQIEYHNRQKMTSP